MSLKKHIIAVHESKNGLLALPYTEVSVTEDNEENSMINNPEIKKEILDEFGAEIEVEGFNQYGEENDFGDSMVASSEENPIVSDPKIKKEILDEFGAEDGQDTDAKRTKYSLDFKLKCIEEAKKTSNREVGRTYGIDPSIITRWTKLRKK